MEAQRKKRLILSSFLLCALWWSEVSQSVPVTLQFTATGLEPSHPSVSGSIGWDADSVTAPINALTSINLTAGGHTFSLSEVGFVSNRGGVPGFDVIGATVGGVDGLPSGTNDFFIHFNRVNRQFLGFGFATLFQSSHQTTSHGGFSITAVNTTLTGPSGITFQDGLNAPNSFRDIHMSGGSPHSIWGFKDGAMFGAVSYTGNSWVWDNFQPNDANIPNGSYCFEPTNVIGNCVDGRFPIVNGLIQTSATPPNFAFPLKGVDPVYLNTEAITGLSADCGTTGGNIGCNDSAHKNTMSLDFDVDKIGGGSATNAKADVVAVAAGTVVRVEVVNITLNGQPFQYPAITVKHDGGYYSEYAEFFTDPNDTSSVFVKAGDAVIAGQKLGTLSAGQGKHLHFQVKFDPSGNGLTTGKSSSSDPNLQGVTIGGRKFSEYKLKGTADAPLQAKILARELPLLTRLDTSTAHSTPAYLFNIDVGAFGVGISDPVFIDPVLAIGYDYQILSGPNFRSVLLPDIGDGLYDLWVWDSLLSNWVFDRVLTHDIEFLFGGAGVDRFRILGIEESAGLDPSDPTAFVTGLTFMDTGRVEMTMTPLTVTVPVPGTLILTLVGLVIVCRSVRERRRSSKVSVGRDAGRSRLKSCYHRSR